MLEYLQTMTTYSGSTGFNPELAKQSLQNYNPILLYGNGHYVDNNRLPITKDPYKDKPGHGWIIDGYCTTKNRVHQIVIYIGLSTWDGEKVLRPSILKQTTV